MTSKLHSLPRTYGLIMILLGIIFLIPSLGIFQLYLIPELWDAISLIIGWSLAMFVFGIISMVICSAMIAYGADIVYYHDKKSNPKSIEDNAKTSEYAPEPDEDENVKQ